MSTTNPVFQVLITSGNQAVLPAGARVDTLKNGQIGVFNFWSGLSVDAAYLAANPDQGKEVFFAVGINRASGGVATAEDVNFSSGQMIQRRNAKSVTIKGYTDEVPKIIEITGFSAMCDTDYAVKLTFVNGQVHALFGYNLLSKTYAYHSSCCPMTACDDCDKVGSAAEVAGGIVAAINADPDKLVSASVLAWKMTGTITGTGTAGNATVTVGATSYTVPILAGDTPAVGAAKIAAQINTQAGSGYRATASGAVLSVYPTTTGTTNTDVLAVAGAGYTITGGATLTATKSTTTDPTTIKALADSGASAGIRITGNPTPRAAFNGSIPVKYVKAGLDFDASIIDGLGACNGVITIIQEPQYPEGKGYDLQEQEYIAGGWNGKPGPYRAYNGLGLQKNGYEYFANAGINYNIVTVGYDQFSVAGWIEHLNNLETVIGIPCTDNITLEQFAAILDEVFDDLVKLADDVAVGAGMFTANCVSKKTSALTPATDGIESLS